ncbi:MAG: CoB--CoM heterodisulfide reductase iron-sulfur subunit B family protein [Nitrospirae bacterium]|nr:CoB--CoM heterodisulfide reductase iron-sulfur subunit B family protein [Nitrospirota bacterium]MCL5238051.1 CoB--CoM heterodisulfide reductase iron-sulfur subunit B family protein [Nitrospirota bacterium]
MRYAFYPGCAMPVKALKYEISTRSLARKLGIELVDVPEFGCCGYPAKSMDFHVALIMAARNLALAEERNMDIVGACTGCVATLSEAKEYLEDGDLRSEVNKKLKALGVKEFTGRVRVRHFARILIEDYGLERLRKEVVNPLGSLEFGVHYGCHYMRPARAHEYFDDPSNPVTLDRLITSAGAKSIDYTNKNLCCGLTIMGISEDTGLRLAAEKLECLSERGVDAMVVACPSCCIAYENNQKLAGRTLGKAFNVPVLYFTQVLGLALGLSERELGFEFNRIKSDKITGSLIL